MSPDYQIRIKELAEQYGGENLIVILGFADKELIEIYALTLTQGDISGVGPLSGVALRLKVYHILEPEVKAEIPEEVYREQVYMMEIAIAAETPIEEISKMLKGIREKAGI